MSNLYQETFEGEKTTKADGLIKLIFGFILGMMLVHVYIYLRKYDYDECY